ncbi:MAG TPA: RAMP superfamily CRISPR-associated protein [Anaerolineae bacterium]|nr:RAMP superfamily CRISPR-associated protein [Anaerolineae bacterium]
MIELTGAMITVSPLHIGTGKKRGTFSETREYVPGRAIRGMVGYYLHSNNHELFKKLRIDEDSDMGKTGVFFKDALPRYVNEKDSSIIKPTVASPVSLRWCKKCKNLMKSTECSNIINGKKCLHEGKKMTGFITKDSITTRKLEKASVNKTIITKCPIIRGGHTSPGLDYELSPYHIESIPQKTKFEFRCIVEDEFVNDLKETLNEAGVFGGLGGYRSRGYGSVAFTEMKKIPVDDVINKRANELSQISNLMMVTNSPMIIRDDKKCPVIGFDSHFCDYASKTFALSGHDGVLRLKDDEHVIKQRITKGIAAGWSIKHENRVPEIIFCIGHGSCVEIDANNFKALAALEVFGVGEMTNSGYGDVYFMEGNI